MKHTLNCCSIYARICLPIASALCLHACVWDDQMYDTYVDSDQSEYAIGKQNTPDYTLASAVSQTANAPIIHTCPPGKLVKTSLNGESVYVDLETIECHEGYFIVKPLDIINNKTESISLQEETQKVIKAHASPASSSYSFEHCSGCGEDTYTNTDFGYKIGRVWKNMENKNPYLSYLISNSNECDSKEVTNADSKLACDPECMPDVIQSDYQYCMWFNEYARFLENYPTECKNWFRSDNPVMPIIEFIAPVRGAVDILSDDRKVLLDKLTGFLEQDERYNASAEYSICPVKYPQCTFSTVSERFGCIQNCSETEILCGDTCINPQTSQTHCGARGNCTSLDSQNSNYIGQQCSATQECIKGECRCPPGENIIACGNECYNKSTDIHNCGGCNISCVKTNAKEYSCNYGQCTLTCNDGYDKYNETADSSKAECKRRFTDCDMSAPECNIQNAVNYCDGGACKFICKPGYHTNKDNSQCEQDTINACGAYNTSCIAGGFGMENVTTAVCVSGKCAAETCRLGFHVFDGRCEENNNQNCGFHGNACQSPDNGTSACSAYGECRIQCSTGFHLSEAQTSCEQNSVFSCAPVDSAEAFDCTQKISNAADTQCNDGVCKVINCSTGYHPNSSYKACVANSKTSCAPVDSSSASICIIKISNSDDTQCDDGVCKAVKCRSGYHPNSSYLSCDRNGYTSCGSAESVPKDCREEIPHSKSGTCSTSGICKVTDCADGYKISDGKCVKS